MSDYNGWTNNATWKLWTEMSNTESTYMYWQKILKELPDTGRLGTLAAKLREYYGASSVNFAEIADALLEGES